MISRIYLTTYLFSVFLISLQIGKHFWPNFSYVSGIKLDYLSPTLHLSDITIGILFTVWVLQARKHTLKIPWNIPILAWICLVFLLASTIMAINIPAALLGLLKLSEFTFFAYTTSQIVNKNIIKYLALVFIIAACIQLPIIWVQFILQKSVGGLLYFLGERSFTIHTSNIAQVYWMNSLWLRPYGTFAHPNVLAFFLFLCSVFIGLALANNIFKRKKTLMTMLLFCGLTILVTFSRSIMLYFIIVTGLLVVRFLPKIPLMIGTLFLGWLISLFAVSRVFDGVHFYQDIGWRLELVGLNSEIIASHWLIGVGLNNYFYHAAPLQLIYSPIYLQPVHNIYLYILVQLGVYVLFCTVLFILTTIRRLLTHISTAKTQDERRYYRSFLILLIGLVGVGIVDHYPLSLQQGQLMTALIIGLCWSTWDGKIKA